MRLLTRDSDYAVRALCHIAGSAKRVVATSELDTHVGVPRPFLRKILQVLQRKKILTSFRGKGGGFALRRDPATVSLAEVMAIFQGPFVASACLQEKDVCARSGSCSLRAKLVSIDRFVNRELAAVNIADLCGRR